MHRLSRGPAGTFVAFFAAVVALSTASPAHAYSTRVHITMANRVREALIASGDGTIALEWSDYSVTLPPDDAQAIIDEPLAFRAGAIGPDNMVFPALTDGTHALSQDPFRQCELLYEDAIIPSERAYALGCFLHGATDAVAHHFVNDFTGETFTLTPLSASRASAFDNVIGHITTEGIIQDAFFRADPSWFTTGALQHDIPRSFVLRNYYSTSAPLWQLMAADAVERLEAARAAAAPDASLYTVVSGADLETYHYLALAPVFVSDAEMERVELRASVVDELADLQDVASARGSTLRVGAGPDAMIGTPDDTTACTTGCAALYSRYFVLVRVLAPRRSAGGTALPSAYDVIMDELGDDLRQLLPALLETIELISLALNSAVTAEGGGLEFTAAQLNAYFAPMNAWADDVAAIDFETLVRAAAPDWVTALDDFFSSIGVTVDLSTILSTIFQPVTDAIRGVVRDYVIAQARTYLEDLQAAYDAQLAPWLAREGGTLAASSPTDLTGTTLDHLAESGLFAYSFNLTAVTLADHRVLLVAGDPRNDGPTSFDASYTPAWSQVGLCDYLRDAVFPAGFSVNALFSVRTADGVLHASPTTEDSPVECHDGSLDAFGAPSRAACTIVGLDELLTSVDTRGSLSRAYPPLHASGTPGCMDLSIAGLPDPPVRPDAGPMTSDGGGVMPGADTGPGTGPSEAGGCACAAAGAPRSTNASLGSALSMAFGLALLFGGAVRRRRRASKAIVLAAIALGLGACGEPMTMMPGTDSGPMAADSGPVNDTGPMLDAPSMSDGGRADAGPDLRRVLLDALGTSVWSALQTRPETSGAGTTDIERAYELEFDAASLSWAEVRNPFGPARRRRLRIFTVDRDGSTVTSTIMSPDTWPSDPLEGRMETWTFEIMAGAPRELHITAGGVTEVFLEEPWAAPTDGLTAEVRAFANDGAMAAGACGNSTTFDRGVVMGFARGASTEVPLGTDVVAGVPVARMGASTAFSIVDVTGFDRLGGTALSQQQNFVVRWTGSVRHGGGALRMREADDVVDGGLFVFLGPQVGSTLVADLFLEVQFFGFIPDATSDTVSRTLAAGDVPIEIIAWRCVGGDNTDVEIDVGGGFRSVGVAISTPIINDTLFPPAL